MIDVGIIGLDTSHAEKFAALIADRTDVTVAGVWDGGDVREDAYVRRFCDEYDTHRYGTPDSMIDDVDAAMVLTVNWDLHRPIAERLLESGITTLVDKPIAGSVDDVAAIRAAADRGNARLCGGSAVPYHPSVSEMRADGGTHDLFSAGYNGPFYYGVHLTDTARRICGSDWSRIEPAAHAKTANVAFDGGSSATLRFDGPTENAAFGLLDVGQTVRTAHIDGSEAELMRMYDPFLDAFVETAKGEREDEDWLFDAATLLLGVQAVLETGERITPESQHLYDVSRDGGAFTEVYKPLY